MSRFKGSLRRLWKVPSPAMMVALVAVVFAAGGTAAADQLGLFNGHNIKPGSIPENRLTGSAQAKINHKPPGPKGETGPQGPVGPQGVAGSQGAKGETGAQGPAGPKGDRGETGATGAVGPQGPTGAQGAKGETGAQGPKGETGPQGPVGLQGVAGSQGAKGETGAQGPSGPQGATGSQGAQGETGAQGLRGETGSQGAKGATGAEGPKGETGPEGQEGTPGRNAGEPIVVTAADLQGWTLATYGDNSETPEPEYPDGRGPEPANVENGRLEFAVPSLAPPLGTQALKMVALNGHPVVAYLPLPPGSEFPLLEEITSASYDTLVTQSPSAFDNVSLQIEVIGSTSKHFASGYTTIVFEQYQNGENNSSTWQRHVVAAGNHQAGKIWSSQAASSEHPSNCSQAAPCPLEQFIAENPASKVIGVKLRIGQNSGEGWAGWEGYVDDVRLGFGEYNRYDLGG